MGEVEKPEVPEQPEEDPKEALSFNAEQRLEFYAMLAWLPDYSAVYDMEAEINGATAMVDSYTSGYRRRQMAAAAGSDNEARRKSVLRLSVDKERMLREKNIHHISFAQAIKGVMFLIEQVKAKVWDKERKDRCVPGRDYAQRMLWKMLEMRPEPEEPRSELITWRVFDQTNVMAGGGTGGHGSKKFGGIGRLDKDGKVIAVQRETYINAFEVFVAAGDCQLSDRAIDVISRKGPYTQDFVRVLPVMAPGRVETFMSQLLLNACAALRMVTDVRLTK